MTTVTRRDLALIASLFEGAQMPKRSGLPDAFYVRLPAGTLDRIESLRGPLPQGEWMRALILQALDTRERTARRVEAKARKLEAGDEE